MTSAISDKQQTVASWLILLLSASCGLIAANLYYSQPLVGPISTSLGLSAEAAGLIVTMTQIGYGIGLLLIVPLGDLFENRRLVLGVMALGTLSLLGAAYAAQPIHFLAASLFIGLGSVAVQILVPYASHLAPEAIRGQVVGTVMSGLMFGIMAARPVASFITALSSWREVFVLSAIGMVLLAMVLRAALPRRIPPAKLSYRQLLASMWQLTLTVSILRRRAVYQAILFAAFSLFWTTTPLLLAGPDYHLSQTGIALFALAGVAGAIVAPLAGRVADRGWTRPATFFAMLAVALAFLITHLGDAGSNLALSLLVAAALLLDLGVSANVVLGQRAIFSLGNEYRSRLNGVYMATFFAGGAGGSALGGWAYAHGGWSTVSWIGFALPVVAVLYLLTELIPDRAPAR